jgi:protoheme IX farnesyltransferase
MASACVINNYTDRYIDAKMERTKKRALVTGEIGPRSALLYAAILGILGFGSLAIWTNWLTVLIGLIGIIDYVILYAYFKRTSVHGTLVGTISGATPPVAGYCAVSGRFDLGALLLFLVLVFWQMAHFYAIAMFRAKDYKAAGIPVLPVVKGMRATKIQIVAYIVAFILATLLLPVYGFTGYIYSVVVVSIGLLWLRVAIIGFNAKDDIVWARKVFKYSLIALLGFSIMVSLANILP